MLCDLGALAFKGRVGKGWGALLRRKVCVCLGLATNLQIDLNDFAVGYQLF